GTESATHAAGIGDTSASIAKPVRNWVALYSRHAELYGRKVELIKVVGSGTSAESARADAIQAVNKYQPFASITGAGCDQFQFEMAVRQVEAMCGTVPPYSWMQKAAPYFWWTGATSSFPHELAMYPTAELMGKGL